MDRRVGDIEFIECEKVLLKISFMKYVKRFRKRDKLSPRFIGPFQILEMVGEVAYMLLLLSRLLVVHPVFHVSMLQRYHADNSHVLNLSSI